MFFLCCENFPAKTERGFILICEKSTMYFLMNKVTIAFYSIPKMFTTALNYST